MHFLLRTSYLWFMYIYGLGQATGIIPGHFIDEMQRRYYIALGIWCCCFSIDFIRESVYNNVF